MSYANLSVSSRPLAYSQVVVACIIHLKHAVSMQPPRLTPSPAVPQLGVQEHLPLCTCVSFLPVLSVYFPFSLLLLVQCYLFFFWYLCPCLFSSCVKCLFLLYCNFLFDCFISLLPDLLIHPTHFLCSFYSYFSLICIISTPFSLFYQIFPSTFLSFSPLIISLLLLFWILLYFSFFISSVPHFSLSIYPVSLFFPSLLLFLNPYITYLAFLFPYWSTSSSLLFLPSYQHSPLPPCSSVIPPSLLFLLSSLYLRPLACCFWLRKKVGSETPLPPRQGQGR